jgi:hypothetical protein
MSTLFQIQTLKLQMCSIFMDGMLFMDSSVISSATMAVLQSSEVEKPYHHSE